MTRPVATAIGFVAVLLWALLALLTVGSGPMPPLQLNTLYFAIGGIIGLIWVAAIGGFRQLAGMPWTVYAFGSLGLLGYHALYFSALLLAPPAQSGSSPIFGPCSSSSSLDSCPENACVGAISLALVWALPGRR